MIDRRKHMTMFVSLRRSVLKRHFGVENKGVEGLKVIAEDKPIVTRLSGGIELNNITFRYVEDMPPVLADDIREMPMGMHTMISEGQGGISGGQRQRLLIARAIAPKPKILMLDEATSALDNITQKQVSDALGKMKLRGEDQTQVLACKDSDGQHPNPERLICPEEQSVYNVTEVPIRTQN